MILLKNTAKNIYDRRLTRCRRDYCLLLVTMIMVSLLFPIHMARAAEKKPLTLQDIMKFKEIHSPAISEQGDWVYYATKPDRGNGETITVSLLSQKSYTIPQGSSPVMTKNGKWLATTLLPDFAALEKEENTKKGKDSKLKNGMALLDTTTGKIIQVEKVKSFAFSDDSEWLFYTLFAEEKKAESKKEDIQKEPEQEEPKTETYQVVLRRLTDGHEFPMTGLVNIMFDPASRFLAYSVLDEENGTLNGLYVRDLKKDDARVKKIHGQPLDRYSNLAWSKTKSRLAFIYHKKKEPTKTSEGEKTKPNKIFSSTLEIWEGQKDKVHTPIAKQQMPVGWLLPADNELSWSEDEDRLFFGLKPAVEYLWSQPEPKAEEKQDIYDIPSLLENRGVDVWHWLDPYINTQQKMEWEKFTKRIYTAIYFFNEGRYLQLATADLPETNRVENPDYTLGFSDLPYRRDLTWDGRYKDVYYINMWNGARKKILTRYAYDVALSFYGRFIVYYLDKHWYLFDIRNNTTRNLTAEIPTPFYNENHDSPSAVPGYGMAGWTENDRAVLIYDKYDIWEFSTTSTSAICLTGNLGRKNKLIFRVTKTDPQQKFIKSGASLLLSAYSDTEKYTAFYGGHEGKIGAEPLLFMPDRSYRFLMKAKQGDHILFTRENFQEFPDLWVCGSDFKTPRQISYTNPQQQDFLWGKAELIEWLSFDGKPLQGVVIKPENYEPAKRYPVLVYYYESFSQELYRYNQVVINHRPCFPYYTGNGYVLFLPDIQFEVGRPGFSAAKCLVPGVQRLIDLGIADGKRIGLHGHSWSGYQTAFIITQSDIFAAAIAGAPVANMTSAYNGIRLENGVARQFQYEKEQSRIGLGLVEAPLLYLENSPIFYADRIHTPLLIEFGDKDGAVPWQQGIELYLTMRRLNKNCIFLQYNDEPHHLKKYPNKLDYTIKMKEYLDHYLKGEPAPKWMTEGVPFRKK